MEFLHQKTHHSQTLGEAVSAMLTKERMENAQSRIDVMATSIPAIARYRSTPQTPPKHHEGETVLSHMVRIVALGDAFASGMSVRGCADLINDPVVDLALCDAEATIRESPALFTAYALMHDIAKPDKLLLVAKPGTAGEKEGFVRAKNRSSSYTTTSELVRFDKLRRAGLADGIEATFDDADKAIIAPKYDAMRVAIVQACGLEIAYTKFLTELCWSHQDIEDFFVTPGNVSAFLAFPARAGKAGINVERFLDALFAVALLDCDLGRGNATIDVFHRLATAEHETMPTRHAAREARNIHAKKLRIKAVLAEHQLDPDTVFSMLGTPLGPERGSVMHQIYATIRGESSADVFGVHAHVLNERAAKARVALDTEGLSV